MILILDTFMPKACMRWATSRPIRPRPRIASVLPLSSDPVYSFLSQRPSLSDPQLWATCLHRNTRICSSLKHQLMCIATTVLRTWGLFESTEVLLYPQIYSRTMSGSQKTLSVVQSINWYVFGVTDLWKGYKFSLQNILWLSNNWVLQL